MKASKHQIKAFLDWCYKKHDAYLVEGRHYDLKTPNEDALIKEYISEGTNHKFDRVASKSYDEFVAAVYSQEVYDYWSRSGGNYCLRHFCTKDTCSECLKGY